MSRARRVAAWVTPIVVLALYIALSLGDPRSLKPLIMLGYPSVQWVDTQSLATWLQSANPPLLLDVREPEEFERSHLPGAQRVDPGTQNIEPPPGRRVVVYCSVGVRSAELAEALGRSEVYNLEGGVFAWANEGRALVNDEGLTDRVHTYGAGWERFVRPTHRAP